MTIEFSDREAPRFADEDEETCGAGRLTIDIPGGGEYSLYCERVKGHEGKHCARPPEDAKRRIVERQIAAIKEEVSKL